MFPTSVQNAIADIADQFEHADIYFGHGTDNAHDEALWLVFSVAGITFDSDSNVLQQVLKKEHWQEIQDIAQTRIHQRIPLAYLLGEAWFYGLSFEVNKHVLVPRSPIAELIQQHFQPWLSAPPGNILDMCTGCGCIGIAAAIEFSESVVDLVDISPEAIKIAGNNIKRHHLNERVNAIQSDLFSALSSVSPLSSTHVKQYDLILANPPYVDRRDLAAMPAEYHAEPQIALGSGDDGLDITRRLLIEAPDYLTRQGVMIVEVGNSWENLEEAFPQVPFLWLEFESGGHGVFVMTRDELLQYQANFKS